MVHILWFWSPLAASWVLMMLAGPLVNAVVARMPDARLNLAALGIALSLTTLVQSPVIGLLTVSLTLARDQSSLHRLTRFSLAMLLLVTVIMVVIMLPPVYDLLVLRWMGAPVEVATRARPALLATLLLPAAIGYRRFCQGLMIQGGLTRQVTALALIRLAVITVMIMAAWSWGGVDGATAGALVLGAGSVLDALLAHVMSRPAVRQVERAAMVEESPPPDLSSVIRFYWPLMITSMVWLWSPTLINVGLTRCPYPIESLAVWPVVNNQVFLASSFGFSFLEAVIALLKEPGYGRALGRFSLMLAALSAGMVALIAYTPLVTWWLQEIAGLDSELTQFAIPALRLSVLVPALTVALSWWRGLIVRSQATGALGEATLISLVVLAVLVWLITVAGNLAGASMAALAITVARLVETVWLGYRARSLQQVTLRAGYVDS
jgi:hypothetical protein